VALVTITWGTLAAAGFAGLGLGMGVVIGVYIVRWARSGGGGGVKHRAGPRAIDEDDPPA
jgi:hypothetical protein